MNANVNPLYAADVLEQRAKLAADAKEAEKYVSQALELRSKTLGSEHQSVGETLAHLGAIYMREKNYAAAEESLKGAQAVLEKALYPEHAKLAPVVEQLADCCLAQGRLDEAEPLLKKVLEIHQKTARADKYDTLQVTRKLVHLYQKSGKWSDAETTLKKAVQAADTPWGPVEDFLYDQAVTFQAQGKDAEAESAFRKAIDAYRQRRKEDGLAEAMKQYAALLRKLGKNDEAARLDGELKAAAKAPA